MACVAYDSGEGNVSKHRSVQTEKLDLNEQLSSILRIKSNNIFDCHV